jgi:two-component system, cell cycle response regulator DivK
MKPTILIVEDDPQNRKLLSELLAVKGYPVLEAHDGEAGVKLAVAQQPGLILMDIQLPKMDGFGAVQLLKGDVRTREIPIWVLTAYAMPGDEARLRTCGCDHYMTKPLDLPDLLARMEHLFGPILDERDSAKYSTGEDSR